MKIWVTRDEPPDGPLCNALRLRELSPILEPVVQRTVRSDCIDELSQLKPDDWLVLTSPFAIDAVAIEPARVPRLAVIGEASRKAAESRSMRVDLVGAGHDVSMLFDELRRRVDSGTIYYPRSALAGAPSPWSGVRIVSPILYETNAIPFDTSIIDRVDVVSVTSPSAVVAIDSRRPVAEINMPFAAIGPTTSDALRQRGVEPRCQADSATFESLSDAIARISQTGS